MEHKLLKPSGLKRPTPVNKNICPKDRITKLGVPTHVPTRMQPPLMRDPMNIQNGLKRTGRAGSPDLPKFSGRPKLRRSNSYHDLTPLEFQRLKSTLPPIQSEDAIVNGNVTDCNDCSSASSISSKRELPARPQMRFLNAKPATTTTASSGAMKRPLIRNNSTQQAKKPTMPTATAKIGFNIKNKSVNTSVSTTGANKPINKRIPPYDFKARYHDLLEKHNALKEKHEKIREQMGSFEGMPEQLEETQAKLLATETQLHNTKTGLERSISQVKELTSEQTLIKDRLSKTESELKALQAEHTNVSEKYKVLNEVVVELREQHSLVIKNNEDLSEELVKCREQLFQSNMERKELHNMVMDLKGNIRVFCRVRPPLEIENNKLLCGWRYPDDGTVEIQSFDPAARNKQNSHVFNFDNVFHPGCRQEDIFELVAPLIQSALDGYNVCIFAYGQTGSGKTYTMDGIQSNPGVIPRTVDLLFDAIKNYKRLGWEYEIKVTFLEIYNEVLYDLLSNEQKDMEIRMASNNKNDIYVSNITEETVQHADHLRQLMDVAKANRATAATVGNERSSRSHAVTKIELHGTHAQKREFSIGRINLVDLAGSESPKTSLRMAETKNINRSLSELTNVILALMTKQDHIPYRNSKLTHLLMPSLGGNSKTLMFINVSPFQECYVESLNSLRFATSVNSCKVAKAKRNRMLNTSQTAMQ